MTASALWNIEQEREALLSVFHAIEPGFDHTSVMWGAAVAILRLREYADCDPHAPLPVPDSKAFNDVLRTTGSADLADDNPASAKPDPSASGGAS